MDISLIGWVGAFLSAVSLIPQAFKIFKTKSAKDISFNTFLIIASGNFCWFLYGFVLHNLPLVITNFIQLSFGVWILTLKLKYKRRSR